MGNALVGRLRDKERELDKLREEKARVERRLRALAPSGTFEVEEGKVILQGEVLFASGSDEVRAESHALMSEMARALSALLVAEPEQPRGHSGHRALPGAGRRVDVRLDTSRQIEAARDRCAHVRDQPDPPHAPIVRAARPRAATAATEASPPLGQIPLQRRAQ